PMSCFLFLGATLWPLLLATGKAQKTTIWREPLGDRTVHISQSTPLEPKDSRDEALKPEIKLAQQNEQGGQP
ncbi:MAG: hypothetical protein ACKVT0_16005, partial [Planctomycetaceae bacterium]